MYSFTIYLDLRFMYVSNDIFQKQTGSLRSHENCRFLYENLNLAEIVYCLSIPINFYHVFGH